MRSIIILLAALTIHLKGFNQIIKSALSFPVSGIADSLRSGADAVYRIDEGTVEILSPSKYNYSIHNVVTVFNQKASRHFRHALDFDKLRKVERIEIRIYDSLGLAVASYTKKDFATKAADDGFSIFTDDKILYLETVAPSYPCTIETTYELRNSGYINLPGWNIASPGEAVEQSKFSVIVPAALDIRFKNTGLAITPEVKAEGDNKTYTWKTGNIPAPKQPEANTYENITEYGSIHISPNQFSYDGFAGEMKTWKDFGAWNYPLYTDEKNFTASQLNQLEILVADCKTTRDKVTALYNHLKKNMRYVSVQLGIGGFKPFPVQYVYEKQYGDCKALTNYMRYMLKAAGIVSYPALVNAGSYKAPVDPAFPADYFNHVILCVPDGADSIWLECTSKNNQAGKLGSFTENKNVLLLTENGGVLVSTPKSEASNNVLTTKTEIRLNEEGGSTVTTNLSCTGDFWNTFYEIGKYNNTDQKKIFTQYLNYKIPETFSLVKNEDATGLASFKLDLGYEQSYTFKAGSKLFFDQRISDMFTEKLKTEARKKDYLFNFPYQKTDTTVFIFPDNISLESFPAKKEITNNFLSYRSECILKADEKKLYVITSLTVKQKVVPAGAYLVLAESFSQLNKNETQKIILRKS